MPGRAPEGMPCGGCGGSAEAPGGGAGGDGFELFEEQDGLACVAPRCLGGEEGAEMGHDGGDVQGVRFNER